MRLGWVKVTSYCFKSANGSVKEPVAINHKNLIAVKMATFCNGKGGTKKNTDFLRLLYVLTTNLLTDLKLICNGFALTLVPVRGCRAGTSPAKTFEQNGDLGQNGVLGHHGYYASLSTEQGVFWV